MVDPRSRRRVVADGSEDSVGGVADNQSNISCFAFN
jgi:hypothetical protein